MIDQIFDMIMTEARTRKDQTLQLSTLIVLLEVQEKVISAVHALQVEDIKSTRLKFRRKEP